ncbi:MULTISPECIES: gallidermin/nisin family lantibiotic [Lacrimispora]|uniref:Gallidermin/nisin family lantibiotic n=1 Tax=Lacrimispora defluvii TaxID=2719233 RepID=A0ABX1VKJ2_9FIRM|nr:gallidermin/nisin family lantibiotic [Lacrimispora defluvii]NNJ28320.1 gallidermin/nisin family lantibiotic [Lacrimispora defluvii]
MNKDFDLDLKMDKGSVDVGESKIASVAYCTPGCLTGSTCGTSECGMTRNCTNTWLCY